MAGLQLVSIVIPCFNEEKFISRVLDSVLANDYPQDRLEVLVADGRSTDGSRGIISDYAGRHPCIRLLDNQLKITSAGLNLGISQARGAYIIIMGAHTLYPSNYISGLVSWLERTGADVAGGTCATLPGADTPLAEAIALGLSHPFGVGNSYFRIGVAAPREVDTVPFGCYRREVFDRIGGFDEDLVRNQDDDLNLRLYKEGGRLLLVPEIVSHYYARDSLGKLWRMFYQYGYFKPLVARKLGRILTARQVVPALFVAGLATTGLCALWSSRCAWLFGVIALSYLGLALFFAHRTARSRGWRVGLGLALVFPALHFSYGLGFLKGVYDFWARRRQKVRDPSGVQLSR
jgi:glycosyltransferase involved in cell wall biosynthesis